MDEAQLQDSLKQAVDFAAQMSPETETPDERAASAKLYEAGLRKQHNLPVPPPTPAPEKAAEVKPPEGDSPKVEVDLEKLALSTRALKRYGFTAKMLNGLSDEDKLDAGAKLLKIQEDNDKAQSDLLTYKQVAEQAKSTSATKTPATPKKEDLAKLRAEFAEEWGDKYLPLFDRQDDPEVGARLERAEAAASSALLEIKRRDIEEQFPEVKARDVWDKVIEKAKKIRSNYDDDDECIADACAILKLKPATEPEPVRERPKADSRERHNGLPAETGRASTGSKMSKKDMQFASFQAFERGDRNEGNRLAALSRAQDL